ncbi:alpha/beta hydrolase [Nocardia sp. NPDC005998]|uniref:alpha/beta fold hydrolase n=1 Tax=Nocardia sp. NPDC005998 TaxID=3156894 RepID=UPI0033A76251
MSAGAMIAGNPAAPSIMLIHGLGGSYRVWDRVVPLLEASMNIVAVQLESTESIEFDADDAAALIDSPTLIVGHSRGGLVATALAERHPDLVSELILLCPPWSPASRLSARRPLERALALPVIGHLMWALASDERQRAAQATSFAPDTAVPDRFVADLRSRGRRNLIRSTHAIDTYLGTRTLADRLQNLPMRIELVFGELDARVAAPAAEFALLHDTHPTILPGVGHTPPWEAPDAVADLITRSLRSTAPAY